MWPALAQKRTLQVLSYDYPPFIEVNRDKPAGGVTLAVVAEAFRRMGTPCKISFYPFPRALLLLETEHADALFTIKKTPERMAKYWFSQEVLLHQDYVIFVAADSSIDFKGDLRELAELSIGVVNKVSYGKVFDDAARSGLFRRLEVAQNYESNFRKLLAKRMDAVVCSRIVGLAMLKRLDALAQAKVAGPPFEVAPSYIMFNKKTVRPETAADFDRALVSMQRDGTLARIEREHLPQ